jgi:cell division protein FtsI/penicillin-binding protein 2
VIKTQERYGKSAIAPHITGYVDGDGNGVSGIEKAYDDILKKYTSSVTESFAVDAQQRTLSGVTPQIITQGDDSGGVVLTLDKQIQLDAQTAADKYLKSGAVIVMDIKTGDILASVSEPEYLPQ